MRVPKSVPHGTGGGIFFAFSDERQFLQLKQSKLVVETDFSDRRSADKSIERPACQIVRSWENSEITRRFPVILGIQLTLIFRLTTSSSTVSCSPSPDSFDFTGLWDTGWNSAKRTAGCSVRNPVNITWFLWSSSRDNFVASWKMSST